MRITLELDPEDSSLLATYVYLTEGDPPAVFRTVEINEGCNADEDGSGNLLGIEFLGSGGMGSGLDAIIRKYGAPDVPLLRKMEKALSQAN